MKRARMKKTSNDLHADEMKRQLKIGANILWPKKKTIDVIEDVLCQMFGDLLSNYSKKEAASILRFTAHLVIETLKRGD